jgi:hypothetical protein
MVVDLKLVLDLHLKWLKGEEDGKKADLEGANLEGANLKGANLNGADLKGANLDFSCLPLWCGSFTMKVDDRLVKQLAGHIARLDITACSPDVKAWVNSIPDEFANDLCKRHGIEPVHHSQVKYRLLKKTKKVKEK